MSQTVQATAKIKDEAGEVINEVTESVDYDFGTTLEDAVSLFGEEVVFSAFKQSSVITLQSRLRAHISNGLTGDELQDKISEWKPGIKATTRKSPAEKLKGLLEGKSQEEIAAILAEAGLV